VTTGSIFGTISRQGFTTRSCNGILPNLTRSRLEFIYLKTSTLTTAGDIAGYFLGVSETFVPDIFCEAERISDANQLAKPALTTQVRQQLIEVYREDIWRLQKLIQRDLQTG